MYRRLEKPKSKKNLQLTQRDKTIIRACFQFRLVTTDQLMKLTGTTSRTKLNVRLRELWTAGFIDRPEIQRQVFAYRNKRPMVHALGQKGAEWLAANDRVWFPKGKGWKTANQLKSSNYLEHRLGTADTVLVFREALKGIKGCRFIDKDELLLTSPGETQKKRYPWQLPTEFTLPNGKRHKRNTIPDYSFAIGDARSKPEKRALLFLEWDNKTEAFVRSDPDQSMILGLYLRYADIYERKLHSQVYGFKNFRVLIVVNDNAERISKMLSIYQTHVKHLCPAGTFLHTTVNEIETLGPLEKIWLTGKGERVRILSR